MAKALLVTYIVALSISSAVADSKECAAGPKYWCKSFQHAEDCGAIRHCTDTVWNFDNEPALTDSSTTCKWCQRILANTYNGIQALANDEHSTVSALADGCKLLPSNDLSSKCTNIVEHYGTFVTSLMKNKRYATLCRLMDVCSSESTTTSPPVVVGQQRCTWGPSYWCSSLNNSRECNSITHCTNQIWSRQAIEKKQNDNICQYCEYIIGKLRSMIINNQTEINVEKWLAGACSMLQSQDAIDKCVQAMSKYADEILVLVTNNIDAGLICHLGQMCKEGKIVVRVQIDDDQSKVQTTPPVDVGEVKDAAVDEQSRMLCTSIVRATYELHVNQQKSRNEIHTFLNNDCQQLSTSELIRECEALVNSRLMDIYDQIINNKELSDICDHPGYAVDSTTYSPPVSQVQCDLCAVVLATTKNMLDAKHPEDKILLYIDENLCSHLDGGQQKNCKSMLETNGEDLIDHLQRDPQSMLLCTYFQVCMEKIIDGTSPIGKNEMRTFLQNHICDHLGPFEDSCNALMEQDTTRLLKTLANDMEGDVLCQMFGICPMNMSFIDNLSYTDDTNKCQRCVDDFSRRKHIAEKLLNHSSAFLHHFCARLPQKDDCVKSVDESIHKLVEFIQSLCPHDICVELKVCNQTLLGEIQPMPITSRDNLITREIIRYIQNEVCSRLGSLSSLCGKLMDSEGEYLFASISKRIDPHQVCSILDICPTTTSFDNCNDKCECCVSKMENYQVRLASFLQTMLTTARTICEHIPDSNECREITAGFESTINEIIARFEAKRICQSLTHCSAIPEPCDINGDTCSCCQNQFNFRQNNFRTIVNEITTVELSLCTDNNCRSLIQSNQQKTLNKIAATNSLTFCQHFGSCSSTFLTNVATNLPSNLQLSDICSTFGDLKPTCEHLLTSTDAARYGHVYMALLKNDPKFIDEDLRESKTNTCDACKNAVQASKDFWINALESVRNVLLQTCDYCSVKDQCRNFYNQRFDNLKSCVDKIDPEQFCQTIHLCSSISLSPTCSICMERLELRKDAVLQGMDRLTGYFDDLCQQYADKKCQIYIQQVRLLMGKIIEEFEPKETCNAVGFCTSDVSDSQMDFNQYEKYLEDAIQTNICSSLGPFEILCKEVIQGDAKQIQALKINYDIKDLMKVGEELTEISSDNTEKIEECSHDKCRCCIFRVIQRKYRTRFIGNRIFSALIRSCDYCPIKQQCLRHWRMAKARFDCRIDHINPKQVCTHLGFCNQTSIHDTIEDVPENCKQKQESEVEQVENSNSTCILCEYVMNILSNYINRQSTEQEIEQSLQKLCNQIPSILQNQCRDYIDNYGPSIIAILLREFDLSTICHKLNLCTSEMKVDITHVIKADVSTCSVCDYVSTHLRFALERNSNEKSLQLALSTVCSYLSDEQYSKCQTIVQLFSPQIRQLELSPRNSFCKQLTICQIPMIDLKPAIRFNTNDVVSNIDSPTQSVVDKPSREDSTKGSSIVENRSITPKCTLCQYVISYLDAILKNNRSEQAFEEALKKVCTILPSRERAQCDEFIKTYGPTLAEIIAGMADPVTACRSLGMCEVSSPTVSPNVSEQTPYTCTICQFIVNRMKYFLGLHQGENEIFASMREACNLFTVETLQKQCKDFLEQYGSYFIPMISNDLEPKLACQRIQICGDTYIKPIVTSTSPSIPSSTRYSKCIFGKNYWCTSRENAKLCNAVELCEREVWSKYKDIIY